MRIFFIGIVDIKADYGVSDFPNENFPDSGNDDEENCADVTVLVVDRDRHEDEIVMPPVPKIRRFSIV